MKKIITVENKNFYFYLSDECVVLFDDFESLFSSTYPRVRKKVYQLRKYGIKYCFYYLQVWDETERNSIHVENINNRSFENHLDHIVPINFGFRNKIDFKLIGSTQNLRIISKAENCLKNIKITSEAKQLLNLWGVEGIYNKQKKSICHTYYRKEKLKKTNKLRRKLVYIK